MNQLAEEKRINSELKARYELEIRDYQNAMKNLELKYNKVIENSDFKVSFKYFLQTEIDFLGSYQ